MSPKPIRLFLARHGNTFNEGDKVVMVGAKTNLPLTSFGHQQAFNLSEFFKNQDIHLDKVYCGSLLRQQETASAISQDVIAHVAALDELDYGPWEGLTDDEIRAQWPQEFENWDKKGIWPHHLFGMSFEHKKDLIQKWVNQIVSNQDETVLAVSSGGIIRLFLFLIPDIWNNIDFKKYKVKTGHVCELLIKWDKVEVIRWNESPR